MRKLNPLPLIILVLFSGLLDFYVFGGVKTLTRELSNRFTIHLLYWLLSGAILFSFLYMLSRVFPARTFSLIFNISFNSFLTIFVSKLVFAALLFGEDIYRLTVSVYNLFIGSASAMPARSVIFSQLVLGLSGIPFFSFLFGVTLGKYYYRVRRSIIYFDDLPQEFDNFIIAQISDIHAGSFDNPRAVQKGIDLINTQKPDLFVFTGDLVNNKATEIVPYLEIFKQVKAVYGKFSILGNHDYGDYTGWESPEAKRLNLDALKQYHAKMGYRLLLDEHVRIKKDSTHISLMGLRTGAKALGSGVICKKR